MQFSLRSLLIGTAVAAVVLGLGRMVLPAVMELAGHDWTMLGWIGLPIAIAGAVGWLYIYVSR